MKDSKLLVCDSDGIQRLTTLDDLELSEGEFVVSISVSASFDPEMLDGDPGTEIRVRGKCVLYPKEGEDT